MSNRIFNPDGVPPPVGHYSHLAEVAPGRRVLHCAGQVGRDEDGSIPAAFRDQARLVWRRLEAILAANDMELGDVVKIVIFMTDMEADIATLREVHAEVLGPDVKPASTGIGVTALALPELKLEIELVAAREG